MTDWAPAPFRIKFDEARDPYTARNALGITSSGGGGISSATPPLSITGGVISIDLSGYQPIDGDLTAISALTGTNTIYYRSGTSVWSPVTVGTGLTFTGGTLAATAVASGAWTAYTPTLAASTGTLTSASATGRYIQIGKNVSFSIRIAITTNGTAATFITATLPVMAFAASQALAGYHETNTEAMSAVILSGTPTVATIRNSAGEYPGANGAAFVISGTYEAA
jgi:hypothetical protein